MKINLPHLHQTNCKEKHYLKISLLSIDLKNNVEHLVPVHGDDRHLVHSSDLLRQFSQTQIQIFADKNGCINSLLQFTHFSIMQCTHES